MWWRSRPPLAVLLALALAGCGLHPIYGDSAAGRATVADLAAVRIDVIQERVGQQMRSYLDERMHPDGVTAPSRYRLAVRLYEDRTDLGLNKQTLSTFSQLQLNANIRLFDVKTGAQLLDTTLHSTTSYVEPTPGFPTLASDSDARTRALTTLGDDIVARLSLYFQIHPTT